jgi:cyclic pyranopterin monophosphate synthase
MARRLKGSEHPVRLTHLDARARPAMVDVSAKLVSERSAEAEARVRLPAAVARVLKRSGYRSPKGAVFDTAILAGVMAAKRTSELIPFCHPLALEHVRLQIGFAAAKVDAAVVVVRCRVVVHHKTGVEMEALTGASVAALTIYDMCKALSHEIRIEQVRLLSKAGGRRSVATHGTAMRQAAA